MRSTQYSFFVEVAEHGILRPRLQVVPVLTLREDAVPQRPRVVSALGASVTSKMISVGLIPLSSAGLESITVLSCFGISATESELVSTWRYGLPDSRVLPDGLQQLGP